MKAIWTHDEAEYHGEHVDFDPIWQWPKPVQQPHPPVFIGGNGPRVSTACCATATAGCRTCRTSETLAAADRRAARAGRNAHVPVTYYGATPENLDRCEAAGVDRALIVLESGPEAEVLASIPSLE